MGINNRVTYREGTFWKQKREPFRNSEKYVRLFTISKDDNAAVVGGAIKWLRSQHPHNARNTETTTTGKTIKRIISEVESSSSPPPP
jgi:hypothetical protein